MSLTSSYLITIKNLESIINSVVGAKAPDRFTNKFLEDLGFKSSNDRLYIGLFKSLGLIDENGVPTSRYHRFLDQSETGKVLAECVQDAYSDLFSIKKDANKLSLDEIKGKMKTLTQGQKSEKIIGYMANTFKALCDVADWSTSSLIQVDKNVVNENSNSETDVVVKRNQDNIGLHYNIQIHLPETTNMAVYDAIFQSLKKHLF